MSTPLVSYPCIYRYILVYTCSCMGVKQLPQPPVVEGFGSYRPAGRRLDRLSKGVTPGRWPDGLVPHLQVRMFERSWPRRRRRCRTHLLWNRVQGIGADRHACGASREQARAHSSRGSRLYRAGSQSKRSHSAIHRELRVASMASKPAPMRVARGPRTARASATRPAM